jgi:tetratricopeptide (TPR) repeat protein
MIKKYVILLLAIFFLYTPLIADSVLGGKDSPSGMIDNIGKKFTAYASGKKNILKAIKLEKKGKIKKANKLYKKALFYLIKANKEKQLDPDILNYLGFVNGKLGKLEDAEIYYLLGLNQNPKHNGINEHLGELYLKTDRIDKAKEQLKVLKNCNCEEFEELKAAIKLVSSNN